MRNRAFLDFPSGSCEIDVPTCSYVCSQSFDLISPLFCEDVPFFYRLTRSQMRIRVSVVRKTFVTAVEHASVKFVYSRTVETVGPVIGKGNSIFSSGECMTNGQRSFLPSTGFHHPFQPTYGRLAVTVPLCVPFSWKNDDLALGKRSRSYYNFLFSLETDIQSSSKSKDLSSFRYFVW
jgi:hypothetical protein